jgi:hypothetical protein
MSGETPVMDDGLRKQMKGNGEEGLKEVTE